jgi:nicotinate (nicotinamide) nucleotide adenylyltransferase
MRFLRRPRRQSRSIALFCGAFHPPTVAHSALAEAAKQHVDEVLWVMPEHFPHKQYEGVGLGGRLRMILESTEDPVAIAQENLFFTIAKEAEQSLPGTAIRLLIGEDGARRVVEWNYGLEKVDHERFLKEHLNRFPILSARRNQNWTLPAGMEDCFEWLNVEQAVESISSTLVRERIARGEDWQDLVPERIRARVAEYYGSGGMVRGQ